MCFEIPVSIKSCFRLITSRPTTVLITSFVGHQKLSIEETSGFSNRNSGKATLVHLFEINRQSELSGRTSTTDCSPFNLLWATVKKKGCSLFSSSPMDVIRASVWPIRSAIAGPPRRESGTDSLRQSSKSPRSNLIVPTDLLSSSYDTYFYLLYCVFCLEQKFHYHSRLRFTTTPFLPNFSLLSRAFLNGSRNTNFPPPRLSPPRPHPHLIANSALDTPLYSDEITSDSLRS